MLRASISMYTGVTDVFILLSLSKSVPKAALITRTGA